MSCGGTYFGVGFTGACGCGCGGFGGCLYNVNVPASTDSTLLFNNINLTGVGVLDSATAPNINFRGVVSGSPELTVALDAGNHTIVLTLDVAAITAAIPQATTAQAGIGETATDAEALAKASITVFITPSNFAAMASTTTFAGLVELATNAEALAGASTTLAITPDDLAYVLANSSLTTTFADAVARAAAVPDFAGQFAAQLDTLVPYLGRGAVAGAWNQILSLSVANENNATIPDTSIDTSFGGTFAFQSNDGTGNVQFNGINVAFNAPGNPIECNRDVHFSNNTVDFDGTVISVLGASATFRLLATDGAGEAIFQQITNFLSTNNVQTGWAVTNPSVTRTLDVAAATLADVRAVLGTLINDLKAVLLPAT